MTDRIAQYILGLGGDDSSLRAVFAGIKSRVRSDVAELEAITAKVELFKGVETRAAAASDAFFKARDAADAYRQEIARIEATGGTVGADLVKSLAAAEKAAASASREYNNQTNQLAKLSTQLKKSGVDTSSLATEQVRLATAYKTATAAATEQEARQALGLKTLKDITPEINRLNAAYNTLRASGTTSLKDLALAQQQLQTRTADLRSQITGVRSAVAGVDIGGFFSRAILPALGLAGGITSVALALKSAVEQARAFDQAIAEIGTVTTATKEQLQELGDGTKLIAQEFGLDLNEAIKSVFDLIRSGVPRENVLEVLRVSAQAAKASFTDLGSAVKVADLLLDAFGANIADLPLLFDKIIKGAENGGATLKDFAANGGALLNVAQQAGVSFDQLITVLTVLVDKSGNAELSIGNLTKIIAALNTDAAKSKLADLGVEGTDLVAIFQAIAKSGGNVEDFLGIKLPGAGVKAAASIAALTNNAKDLPSELEKIAGAAGTMGVALAKALDAPAQRSARFNTELQLASDAIGHFVGSGSALQALATNIIHQFNEIPAAFDAVSNAAKDTDGSWLAMLKAFLQTDPIASNAARATVIAGQALHSVADEAKQTTEALKPLFATLADLGPKLLASITAIQQAAARDIADATARADAQIVQLDRAKNAEAQYAADSLDIQLKLAAQRFAIIRDSEDKINAALEKAIAAREAAQRRNGVNEKQIAQDSSNARIGVLSDELTKYQAHYNALIGLAQNFAAKAQAAELARVSIAESVRNSLKAIALEGVSDFDAYYQKQKDIDELISKARQAALTGDIAKAKEYFDQAIAETNTLKSVTDANGVVVVTQLQARTDKMAELDKIAKAANESIGDQGKAAATGANKAIEAANQVEGKILELQAKYDKLKETVSEGLSIKAELDETSVQQALDTIAQLTAPRVLPIVVQVVGGTPGAPGGVPPEVPAPIIPGLPLNRGGYVQKFAGGGSVFRMPSWSKVPGSGDADMVPALLKSGSFVIRKSAAQKYGDGIMGNLARFAVGGIAQTILSPPAGLLSRLLGLGLTGDTVGTAGPYVDTLAKLNTILETARALPKGAPGHAFGVPIQDWAGTILSKWQTFSEDRRKAIDTAIQADFSGLMSSIQEGLRQHVEVNVAFELAALALRAGGAQGDNVPALLTPGEWVIPRGAVQKLGATFLNAINSGRVAASSLGGFLGTFAAAPPIPRFATGGPVPGASIPSGSAASLAAGGLTVNVYGAPSDFKDEAAVRRLLLPTLREFQRRSRDK